VFLGNIFWFADKKIQKTRKRRREILAVGNHKEQRTGFKSFFFSFSQREENFFTHVEKKRERKRKNREEKSPTVHHATHTIIGAHTHAARARAKEEEEKFYA